MNQKDRGRLQRLRTLITTVPYPQSGGAKTASISGFVAYQNDMRNLLPVIDRIITGMICESIGEFEEGEDYENPDALLDVAEAWIQKRKRENWINIPEYDFRRFYESKN